MKILTITQQSGALLVRKIKLTKGTFGLECAVFQPLKVWLHNALCDQKWKEIMTIVIWSSRVSLNVGTMYSHWDER